MLKFLLPIGMMVYPVWLGAQEAGLTRVAIFVIILAISLFFFGPKSQDVQDNPSRPIMALFSLVLAAGLTGVGYFIGYLVFA